MRVLASVFVVLAGCHASTIPIDSEGLALVDAPRPQATIEAALDDLAGADLVCFGEVHDRATDHRIEAELFEALLARSPEFALGLEMVESSRQYLLDRFVAGAIPLESLDAALEWDTTWGIDFAMYAPLLEMARAHGRPIVALNARREVVRKVVSDGAEAADAAFPDEVFADGIEPEYVAFVRAALASHPNLTDATLERFVVAQRTWDETMARRAVAALGSPGAARILVLAGAMHCGRGVGIPAAVARRAPISVRIVLADPTSGVPPLDDRPIADYVLGLRSP